MLNHDYKETLSILLEEMDMIKNKKLTGREKDKLDCKTFKK